MKHQPRSFPRKFLVSAFLFNQIDFKMTKSDVVDALAEKTGVSKKQAEAVLDAFQETVKGALQKGEKITLRGFGTFSVKQRAEKNGVNPATRERIVIPAKRVPALKFSDDFKV